MFEIMTCDVGISGVLVIEELKFNNTISLDEVFRTNPYQEAPCLITFIEFGA